MKDKIKKNRIILITYGIIILLDILMWISKAFSDLIIKTIFRLGLRTYSAIMSIFPFSVGEWFIVIGILLVVAFVILVITIPFVKNEKFKIVRNKYIKTFFWILAGVGVIMSFNCVSLYHGSTFAEKNLKKSDRSKEKLIELREMIITNGNRLSLEMERDKEGYVIYSEDYEEECKKAMKNLGKEYPMFSGYYPNPKKLFFSDFASQQYLGGVYFPFTLEANYNKTMYNVNYPATICHEYTHLKGIILEDEANFLGYLACVLSDDKYLQYSGYSSVYGYVDRDLRNILNEDDEYMKTMTMPNELFNRDFIFLTNEEWERVEKKAVFSTETVDAVSETLTDTSLKVNGVEEGMKSYSMVVNLLLDYYDQK
ncbi:MAG: DUF3810 domain-containing protein [Lachnospiraceae bacterium]|nr:DUF3810 domain-containing protein [Lachnospiraceae bacterium]